MTEANEELELEYVEAYQLDEEGNLVKVKIY